MHTHACTHNTLALDLFKQIITLNKELEYKRVDEYEG